MNADHIKYLKDAVESSLKDKNGNCVFDKKFYEIYPKAESFKSIVPCAALREFPVKNRKVDSYHTSSSSDTEVSKVRLLVEQKHSYQIDLYSCNAYEHIRDLWDLNSVKPFAEQLSEIIVHNQYFNGYDGRRISVECTSSGFIGDEAIVNNIYMSYVRVTFTDGIYSSESVTKITDINLNQGGLG